MDKRQSNISELLNPVIEALPEPAIVLNFDLKLVLLNQAYLNLTSQNQSIEPTALFDEKTLDELKKKFLSLRENNQIQKITTVGLFLSDSSIKSVLTINRIQFEEEEYFLVIISKEENFINDYSNVSILVKDELKNYLDEELVEYFNEMSSLLPFTLILKNRIKKILDARSEIICLKDEKGRIILPNSAYEKTVGVNLDEPANRATDFLIYPYQFNLLRSACEYLKLTRKAIVINGLNFTSEEVKGKSLILLPITDKQGKFYYSATIISKTNVLDNQNHLIFGKIFSEFPLPILILSKDGIIQHANEEFIKLVGEKLNDLMNSHIQQIFPFLLTENLSSFSESELKEEQIQIDESFNPVDLDFAKYFLKVKKHFDSQGKLESLILLF
ncbi:MAG: PAS domain-containing protein, partial [Ignavibacterium sp.]|nr:PAS domain-containing protein [Ignavibacterium sp.]